MELNELRKIAEDATPGPWEACSERDADGTRRYTVNPERELDTDICAVEYGVPGSANVEFIATFDPPTVLALLSRLEQAEQAVARVRVALTEVQGRGERISEMPNTGSIRSQERAGRGEGYLEATRLAFRALDGDGRG